MRKTMGAKDPEVEASVVSATEEDDEEDERCDDGGLPYWPRATTAPPLERFHQGDCDLVLPAPCASNATATGRGRLFGV